MIQDPRLFTSEIADLPIADAASNLFLMATTGQLRRTSWQSRDEKGRATACLLGAMHAGIQDTIHCPGQWMPGWLAVSIINNFDSLDNDAAEAEAGKQFAIRMPDFVNLTDEDWENIWRRTAVALIRQDTPDQTEAIDHLLTQQGGRPTLDAIGRARDILKNPDYTNFRAYKQDFFDALFDALDLFLPPRTPRNFTFNITTTIPVTVTATSLVEALAQARIVAPEDAILTNVPERTYPPEISALFDIYDEDQPGGWYGHPIRTAVDFTTADARLRGKPYFPQSGQTEQVMVELQQYWGFKPNPSPVPKEVRDIIKTGKPGMPWDAAFTRAIKLTQKAFPDFAPGHTTNLAFPQLVAIWAAK
jgi:hypothetical protein